MSKAIQKRDEMNVAPMDQATIEALVFDQDLSRLNPAQRVAYYSKVCESLGLNPATKPFGYIKLNNKLVLYALRNCTDQLMATRKISTSIVEDKIVEDLLVVKVKAWTTEGRETTDIGVLSIRGATGESKANLFMKCLTKAKRRAILSLVGLSFPDESEVETIPNAQVVEAEVPKLVESTVEREVVEMDAEYSQVVRPVAPPTTLRPRTETVQRPAPKAAEDPLQVKQGKVLNSILGRGKKFGTNGAAAKEHIRKLTGKDVMQLTSEECDATLLLIANAEEVAEMPDVPPPVDEDFHDTSLDQEAAPETPFDEPAQNAPERPSPAQIKAIKDAWVKTGIPAKKAPEFLKFLTAGRQAPQWSMADFNNMKSFLKDHYVEPKA